MKGSYIVFMLLVFTAFDVRQGECLSNPEKVQLQAALRAATALEREFDIQNCGMSGKANQAVDLIRLNFVVNQELDLAKAREVIVPLVNRFIAILNADELLRPYMSRYPFNYDNVELTIYFKTKEGQTVYHPYLHMAALKRGQFKYATLDKKDPYPYEEVVYEKYLEAQKKVY